MWTKEWIGYEPKFQSFGSPQPNRCCLVAQSCPTLVTPWTVTFQAPLSMRFPRQEYWRYCYFLLQGNLSGPGIELLLLHWQENSLPLSHQESPSQPNNQFQILHFSKIMLPITYFFYWFDNHNWLFDSNHKHT